MERVSVGHVPGTLYNELVGLCRAAANTVWMFALSLLASLLVILTE